MSKRVLVAGIGNIFFGDDGFGVEVAAKLAAQPLPEWVKVEDFGIRGLHLAFEIMNGYEEVILVDAAPRGGAPGSVYVIEPDPEKEAEAGDPHGMTIGSVFGFMRNLSGERPHFVLVGCEPGPPREEMGLSDPVRQAVDVAVDRVLATLREKEKATC